MMFLLTCRERSNVFVPAYSAYTKKHHDGTVTLTICVEGFDSVLEAREFLHFFIDDDIADEMQEDVN